MGKATSIPGAEAAALSRWENEGGAYGKHPARRFSSLGVVAWDRATTPSNPGHHTSGTLVPGKMIILNIAGH
jgi:hypothetical protein